MSVNPRWIYDRTLSDVINGTKKGYYNADDLNRIQDALQYVSDRLSSDGYSVTLQPPATKEIGDIPLPSVLQVYLTDLAILRGVIAVTETTPEVPADMAYLTWQEANDIEKILHDIDCLIANMEASWYYSGDLVAGEV